MLATFTNPYNMPIQFGENGLGNSGAYVTAGPLQTAFFVQLTEKAFNGLKNLGADIAIHTDNPNTKGVVLSSAPTATDDILKGYEVGDFVYSKADDEYYVCVTNTVNGAVWSASAGTAPFPAPPSIWVSASTLSDVLALTPGTYTLSDLLNGLVPALRAKFAIAPAMALGTFKLTNLTLVVTSGTGTLNVTTSSIDLAYAGLPAGYVSYTIQPEQTASSINLTHTVTVDAASTIEAHINYVVA